MAALRRHICDGHIVCNDVINYYHDVVAQSEFCAKPALFTGKKTDRQKKISYTLSCFSQRLSPTYSARKKAYKARYIVYSINVFMTL